MKTIPRRVRAGNGPEILAFLEQLDNQPQFREWLEQEFPPAPALPLRGVPPRVDEDHVRELPARRRLVDSPPDVAVPRNSCFPFGKQPETTSRRLEILPPPPRPRRRDACLAKWTDGRPTKLEPATRLFRRALAPIPSSGGDPQPVRSGPRHRTPQNGNDVDAAKVVDAISGLAQKHEVRRNGGEVWISPNGAAPRPERGFRHLADKVGPPVG